MFISKISNYIVYKVDKRLTNSKGLERKDFLNTFYPKP